MSGSEHQWGEGFKVPAGPGDALINSVASFVDLEHLRREFDLLKFFDFCSALEAVVLHETLHSVGEIPRPDQNPLLNALVMNGILRLYFIESEDPDRLTQMAMSHPRITSLRKTLPLSWPINEAELISTLYGSAHSMTWDLIIEDLNQIPLVLSARTAPLYLTVVKDEQIASHRCQIRLAEVYKDVRDALFKQKAEFDGFDSLLFPPIAFEVLEQCQSIDALEHVLLDVRERYAGLRKRFKEADEFFRSDDVSIRDKIREKEKLFNSLNQIFSSREKKRMTTMLSLAQGLNDLSKIDGIADGVELGDINWSRLVSYLIGKADRLYWRLRLRPIHCTKNFFLDRAFQTRCSEVVARLFGHQITRAEISEAQRYEKKIEEIKKSMSLLSEKES